MKIPEDGWLAEPERDSLAISIARQIHAAIERLFNGETTTPLTKLIYDAIAEYDRARIEQAKYLMELVGEYERITVRASSAIVEKQ
jgi:hypothetical protein